MPKVNCAVINCSNSTYKLKKWKQEICYEHNHFDSSCKREHCQYAPLTSPPRPQNTPFILAESAHCAPVKIRS